MLTVMLAGAAALTELAFIQGDWCSEALGGRVIERWEAPVGDAMTGTMTLVRNDAVVFHEFFAIVEESGSLVLLLKHFHPDLASWEPQNEAVRFPLRSLAPGRVVFDGLSIEQPAADRLRVEVASGEGGSLVFDHSRC